MLVLDIIKSEGVEHQTRKPHPPPFVWGRRWVRPRVRDPSPLPPQRLTTDGSSPSRRGGSLVYRGTVETSKRTTLANTEDGPEILTFSPREVPQCSTPFGPGTRSRTPGYYKGPRRVRGPSTVGSVLEPSSVLDSNDRPGEPDVEWFDQTGNRKERTFYPLVFSSGRCVA